MQTETVYLIHFSPAYKHARHYLGSALVVEARLAQHRAGQASPLTAAAVAAGCELVLARTWPGGRALERKLKDRHQAPDLCPICNPSSAHRLGKEETHA